MKQYLCALLLVSGSSLLARSNASIFDELDKTMKEMHEEMDQRFKALEDYMAQQRPAQKAVAKDAKELAATKKAVPQTIEVLPVKDGDQFVTVKLNLGELEKDTISIEAFEKSLKGSAKTKTGSTINFYVQDGRIFGLATKNEIKENKQDDHMIFDSWSVSSSTKEVVLPLVKNLRHTDVAYENGVLTLKFDRVPQDKGTKLNVK